MNCTAACNHGAGTIGHPEENRLRFELAAIEHERDGLRRENAALVEVARAVEALKRLEEQYRSAGCDPEWDRAYEDIFDAKSRYDVLHDALRSECTPTSPPSLLQDGSLK